MRECLVCFCRKGRGKRGLLTISGRKESIIFGQRMGICIFIGTKMVLALQAAAETQRRKGGGGG